jgi:hypothetical protein
LEIERPVNFSVLFVEESLARAAAECVSEIADEVSLEFNADWKKWDMTATKRMALTHDGITSYERKLGALVAQYQGSLDGWGSFGQ